MTDIEWLYRCGAETPFIRNTWILAQDVTVRDVRTADRPIPESEERISLRVFIAPGSRADTAAYSLNMVEHAVGITDPIGSLLMAGAWSRAALTMVDGHAVVRDGTLTRHDEKSIVHERNKARRMFTSAGKAALKSVG